MLAARALPSALPRALLRAAPRGARLQSTAAAEVDEIKKMYEKKYEEKMQRIRKDFQSAGKVKKPYTTVAMKETSAGFQLLLDGKEFLSPAQRAVVLPSREVMQLMVKEFEQQDELMEPSKMPMATLVCTAVDIVNVDVPAAVGRITPYLKTDSLCFPVGRDSATLKAADQMVRELHDEQEQLWAPLRSWYAKKYSQPATAVGVSYDLAAPRHDDKLLFAVEQDLLRRSAWQLAALDVAVGSCQSLICGEAIVDRGAEWSVDEAIKASMLEELAQRSRWGTVEDEHGFSDAARKMWCDSSRTFAELMP